MTLPPLRVFTPTTWAQLFDLMDGATGTALYMGGTDLFPRMRSGEVSPTRLLDVKQLPEMRRHVIIDGLLHIGAAVTFGEIARSERVERLLPSLAELAGAVGNVRVRNAGTLGGNVAAAVPASDPSTLLLALDAEVVVRDTSGWRTVPMNEWIVGPRRTVAEPGQVVEAIRIPLPDAGSTASFRRLSLVEGPVANAALVRSRDGCRLVVGAVSERPRRLREVEDLVTAGSDGAAAGQLAGTIVGIRADTTLPERYLRRVVGVLVERLVNGGSS